MMGAPLSSMGRCAVACDEQRVIGEPDDRAGLQDVGGRVLERLARILVDDLEDVGQRVPGGLGQRPAREAFGHLVHEPDLPRQVGRDHGIADARQGDAQQLALLPGLVLGALAPVHLRSQRLDFLRQRDEARRRVLSRHEAQKDERRSAAGRGPARALASPARDRAVGRPQRPAAEDEGTRPRTEREICAEIIRRLPSDFREQAPDHLVACGPGDAREGAVGPRDRAVARHDEHRLGQQVGQVLKFDSAYRTSHGSGEKNSRPTRSSSSSVGLR